MPSPTKVSSRKWHAAQERTPNSLLEEYKLDEKFLIGMKRPVTQQPFKYISDPPHCLKRLAGAVRSRNLQYNHCRMTGQLLYDVWQAIRQWHGEDTSLTANQSILQLFFYGGGVSPMNISSASRLFSNTTRQMIDEVVGYPEKYPLVEKLPQNLNREAYYSKVAELLLLIYTFFDLCNGKEGDNPFVRFDS